MLQITYGNVNKKETALMWQTSCITYKFPASKYCEKHRRSGADENSRWGDDQRIAARNKARTVCGSSEYVS